MSTTVGRKQIVRMGSRMRRIVPPGRSTCDHKQKNEHGQQLWSGRVLSAMSLMRFRDSPDRLELVGKVRAAGRGGVAASTSNRTVSEGREGRVVHPVVDWIRSAQTYKSDSTARQANKHRRQWCLESSILSLWCVQRSKCAYSSSRAHGARYCAKKRRSDGSVDDRMACV